MKFAIYYSENCANCRCMASLMDILHALGAPLGAWREGFAAAKQTSSLPKISGYRTGGMTQECQLIAWLGFFLQQLWSCKSIILSYHAPIQFLPPNT